MKSGMRMPARLAAVVTGAALCAGLPTSVTPAHHGTRAAAVRAELTSYTAPARSAHLTGRRFRLLAYDWAKRQAGKPYEWGGTGPSGYDCSGLLYAAYGRLGFHFGRTTYQMLASGRLRPVRHPKRGDLAFYGSGHVEIYVGGNVTYGALEPGTTIGWHTWNASWHPTIWRAVIGAGHRS